MKKVGFAEIYVSVEGKLRVMKLLETPTLLFRLLKKGEIEKEEYEEKLKIYQDAIERKNTLLKNELKENQFGTEMQLRDYQQKIVDYAETLKSFAIFDEPRLGKTPTVIKLLERKNLINEKVFVISPGKVTGNWIKRFEEWANAKAKKFEGKFEKEQNIYVSTYARVRLSLEEILKWKPKVAILDEAHVLRNSKGNRQKLSKKQKELQDEKGLIPINKSILKVGKMAENRYSLSGTPSVNSPEDTFAILQFIMPNTFDSYWSFAYYFFEVDRNFMGGREIKGYKSEEKQQELQEILDYCSSNNKQKESMKWLIPPKKIFVELELNEEQKALEIDLIEKGRIGEIFVLNILEQMTHYSSVVINPKILKQIKAKTNGCKTEFLLDYLMDNPDKNIAIFSSREEAISLIKKEIKKEFPNKVIYEITGKTKDEESIKIQDIINKKSKKSDIILLGTIGTCKEGISIEGLDVAIAIDQVWVPSDMEQLGHRLDATTPEAQEYFGEKEFIILQVPGTIDTIINNALILKKSTTEVINDYKKFIENRRIKNG
jgi:hypothetical protein